MSAPRWRGEDPVRTDPASPSPGEPTQLRRNRGRSWSQISQHHWPLPVLLNFDQIRLDRAQVRTVFVPIAIRCRDARTAGHCTDFQATQALRTRTIVPVELMSILNGQNQLSVCFLLFTPAAIKFLADKRAHPIIDTAFRDVATAAADFVV